MLRSKFRVRALPACAVQALSALPILASAAVYTEGASSTTFDCTLKILANCVISADNLDFGRSRGAIGAPVSVSSTILVTCSDTTPYNVGLSAGSGAGSTTATRFLSGSDADAGKLQFNLFQNAGSTNWGNTQGTDTRAGTGSGAPQPFTVYGQIPAQKTPLPDVYKSIITATVFF